MAREFLGDTVTMLNGVLVTGAGESFEPRVLKRTFQATGFISGGAPGSGIVDIEVSNDGTNWLVLGTITLVLGVAVTTDGFTSDAPWRFVRANATTVSGTDAEVTVIMGG